jgi:hypothetical protein
MCPGIKNLIRNIEQKFEDGSIDSLTCRQWMTADISTLETTAQFCGGFVKSLAEKLNIQIHQAFVAWQLSCFYEVLKLRFKTDEIAIYYNL